MIILKLVTIEDIAASKGKLATWLLEAIEMTLFGKRPRKCNQDHKNYFGNSYLWGQNLHSTIFFVGVDIFSGKCGK